MSHASSAPLFLLQQGLAKQVILGASVGSHETELQWRCIACQTGVSASRDGSGVQMDSKRSKP